MSEKMIKAVKQLRSQATNKLEEQRSEGQEDRLVNSRKLKVERGKLNVHKSNKCISKISQINILPKPHNVKDLSDLSDLSYLSNFKKKVAFTLAELLITLAVVGVIAAITIPIIIKNYQKTVWVSQLKKSASMFSQGFGVWMADEGVDDMIRTRAFAQDVDIYSKSVFPSLGYNNGRVQGVFQDMKKYFKITYIGPIENYSYKMLGPGTSNRAVDGNHVILLADGTMFYNYSFRTSEGYALIELYLDVNGTKGPNILGRDIFHISFLRNGKFYSKFWHKLCNPKSGEDPSSNGLGCVEKIMNDGWKMNY